MPVTTVGVTAAMPVSPAAITGVPEAVADVSTKGWIAADSIPAAAMVGADTGSGVGKGEAVCGAGVDPDSIACMAPADNDCVPAAAGCPVIIPVANDCPSEAGDMPCPEAAGENDPPGRPGAAGIPVGIPGVVTGGGTAGGLGGIGPWLPLQLASPNAGSGGRRLPLWAIPALPLGRPAPGPIATDGSAPPAAKVAAVSLPGPPAPPPNAGCKFMSS